MAATAVAANLVIRSMRFNTAAYLPISPPAALRDFYGNLVATRACCKVYQFRPEGQSMIRSPARYENVRLLTGPTSFDRKRSYRTLLWPNPQTGCLIGQTQTASVFQRPSRQALHCARLACSRCYSTQRHNPPKKYWSGLPGLPLYGLVALASLAGFRALKQPAPDRDPGSTNGAISRVSTLRVQPQNVREANEDIVDRSVQHHTQIVPKTQHGFELEWALTRNVAPLTVRLLDFFIGLSLDLWAALFPCHGLTLALVTSNADTGRKRMYESLMGRHLFARCADPDCCEMFAFRLPVNDLEMHGDNFMRYTIARDPTVVGDRRHCYLASYLGFVSAYGIELKSRVHGDGISKLVVASSSRPGHVHFVKHEDEFAAVMQRLREDFGLGRWAVGSGVWSLVPNRSCGMHIHVNIFGAPISLSTAKNLAMLCVVNERALDSLHAAHRIAGVPRTRDDSLRDVSQAFRSHSSRCYNWPVSGMHSFYQTYNVLSALEEIRAADTIEKLQKLFPGRKWNLNLWNLSNEGKDLSKKNTLEFRQHASPTSYGEVRAWSEVCTRMLGFAGTTSEADMFQICTDQFRSREHDIGAFLAKIDCSFETIEHYRGRIVDVRTGSFWQRLERRFSESRYSTTNWESTALCVEVKDRVGGYGHPPPQLGGSDGDGSVPDPPAEELLPRASLRPYAASLPGRGRNAPR